MVLNGLDGYASFFVIIVLYYMKMCSFFDEVIDNE